MSISLQFKLMSQLPDLVPAVEDQNHIRRPKIVGFEEKNKGRHGTDPWPTES